MFCINLTIERYQDGMVLRVFIVFIFGTNSKKEQLGENDFHYCYSNFFESVILKVT